MSTRRNGPSSGTTSISKGWSSSRARAVEIIELSDAEVGRWIKAGDAVIADFKKDLTGKGYKLAEIDSWLSFIKERIEYWKGQEKAKKIATVYKY